jgi:dolichol-phosphate mannosyltransferase
MAMDADRRSSLPAPGSVLCVVIATRNEADSIGPVLSEVHEAAAAIGPLIELRAVVVDDGSVDGTSDVAHDWAARLGLGLDVIDGPGKGLGAAVVHGVQYAVTTFGPQLAMVANFDGDGQHDARELPTLLRAMLGRHLDVVIGSRWVRGGRSYGTTRFRTVGSKVGNGVYRAMTGVRGVHDATTSFRIYSTKAIDLITSLTGDLPSGFAFFSAIVTDASRAGLTIGEVPITFRPRYLGESKLTGHEVQQFFRSLPSQRRRRPPAITRRFDDMVTERDVDVVVGHGSGYTEPDALRTALLSARTTNDGAVSVQVPIGRESYGRIDAELGGRRRSDDASLRAVFESVGLEVVNVRVATSSFVYELEARWALHDAPAFDHEPIIP